MAIPADHKVLNKLISNPNNLMNQAKLDLGRMLYFDPRLSKNCIYRIDFEEVIDLGKMFDQYAIFYRSMENIGYYECASGEAITQRSLQGH